MLLLSTGATRINKKIRFLVAVNAFIHHSSKHKFTSDHLENNEESDRAGQCGLKLILYYIEAISQSMVYTSIFWNLALGKKKIYNIFDQMGPMSTSILEDNVWITIGPFTKY